MGNIIGEPFGKGIKKQVEVRQQKIGQINRDQNILSWANSKTAFLRLASSVNIDDELAKNFGDGMSGDQLARKCVLYNGVTTTDKDAEGNIIQNPMKGGIATPGDNYSAFNNPYSYGYGGLEYGFRPMPGITGAQVSFYNRGSLSSATIQVKAFTPQQLNLIELLYMRVGFTILLEWGHTQYFNNEGEYQTQDTFVTKPFQGLFDGKSTFDDILKKIREERELKSYNYDAFFGKIKNFNWAFNPDGSYDITISAVSVGDIIESLNIHRNMIVEDFAGVEKEIQIDNIEEEEDDPLQPEIYIPPIDNTQTWVDRFKLSPEADKLDKVIKQIN